MGSAFGRFAREPKAAEPHDLLGAAFARAYAVAAPASQANQSTSDGSRLHGAQRPASRLLLTDVGLRLGALAAEIAGPHHASAIQADLLQRLLQAAEDHLLVLAAEAHD